MGQSSKIWMVAASLAVAAVLVVWRPWQRGPDASSAQSASAPAPGAVHASPASSQGGDFPWARAGSGADDPQALREQQGHAASAAVQDLQAPPLQGRLTQRPEFVSELEWRVLQSVAERSPDPDAQLTHLVNNLRFMKQLDTWRALPATGDTTQRKALAQALLDGLPDRVKATDFDMAGAKQLQTELIDSLVDNPAERANRAAIEASRLPAVPAATAASAS